MGNEEFLLKIIEAIDRSKQEVKDEIREVKKELQEKVKEVKEETKELSAGILGLNDRVKTLEIESSQQKNRSRWILTGVIAIGSSLIGTLAKLVFFS